MSKAVRQSNFELLRLVAMFMVLMLHANFFALGEPTLREWQRDGAEVLTRVGMESLAVVAVNVFVILSGWFGIRASWRGGLQLLFSVAFLQLLCIAVGHFVFAQPAPLDEVAGALSPGGGLWFVRSYLILYVLSPCLEGCLERWPIGRRRRMMLLLLLTCCAWGWWADVADFGKGYSALHFVVMYLLGRYLRLSRSGWTTRPAGVYAAAYLVLSVATAVAYVFPFVQGETERLRPVFYYNCPLVVLSSVSFFLFFSRLEFRSPAVNRLAASALSVYVVHQCFIVSPHFVSLCRSIHGGTDGIVTLAAMAAALAAVMAGCLTADRLRICAWKFVVAAWERIAGK